MMITEPMHGGSALWGMGGIRASTALTRHGAMRAHPWSHWTGSGPALTNNKLLDLRRARAGHGDLACGGFVRVEQG